MYRFEEKRVQPFHVLMVNKHLGKLFSFGVTTCESPFLRHLIYKELRRRSIQYTSRMVGWGHPVRWYNRIHWQPSVKLAYAYLKKGNYNPDRFKDSERVNEETTGVNEETRLKLFDVKISEHEKIEILIIIYNFQEKQCEETPLLGTACKTIKRIRVQCPWSVIRLLYIAHRDTEHCGETFARLPMEILVLIEAFVCC